MIDYLVDRSEFKSDPMAGDEANPNEHIEKLFEVLDPEQNSTFIDHYLDVEYSLADVLFICTANTIQNITGPLLDRMEVIHLSGYSELEKQHIANQFLTHQMVSGTKVDSFLKTPYAQVFDY